MKNYIIKFISIPKSLYFNLKCFDFMTAIKLPVIISYNTRICSIRKGSIELKNYDKKYRIYFGFGGSSHIISNRYSVIDIKKNAKIIFYGKVSFAEGCSIRSDFGKISIGKNTSFNKNCIIDSEKEIKIGNDVLCGFNVTFFDSDGHNILYDGKEKESKKSTIIGDHCWICGNVTILKGTKIEKNSIIAYGSIVTKQFDNENILIGGFPAKEIKNNTTWKK